MQSYDTILGPAGAEFVEKRSRFLAEIRPVADEQDFAAFLAGVRAQHHDARHNCWAYILREGGAMRYSDDGEPQGTAGVPILEVLRREGLQGVGLVVTRYFGGILLGAGGLNRAYTHSAKLAVDAAQRVSMRLCDLFMLEVPYPLYERLGLLLERCGALVLDCSFAADVTVTARMDKTAYPGFCQELTELTGGRAEPVHLGEEFAPV